MGADVGEPRVGGGLAKPAGPDHAPADHTAVAAALLAVYLIWGSTYLAIRIALEGFPPFLLLAIRFLLAGAALYLFLRARGVPPPTRAEWGGAALVGGLLLGGGMGGTGFALQWVASGLSATWVATTPLWTALFAGLWGRWPTRLEWAGLGLGLVGAALLNVEGDLRAHPVGALSLVLATLAWAFGSVWSSRLPLPPGMMASAAEMLAGGGLLLLLSAGSGERMAGPPGPRAFWALGYLVVFGSVIAFSAYLYLLGRVRPVLATSYAYVNPVVAVALGAGLAGERITATGLLALPLILAGVALAATERRPG